MKRQPAITIAEAKRAMAGEMASCRQKLLVRFPFTASVMMSLELVPVRDIRLATACTDGSKIYYDLGFWRRRPKDRAFILAHETWHCIMLHFLRRQNRDPFIFNVAIDIETNRILAAEGLSAPQDALLGDQETAGMSAEEIYERLLENAGRNGDGNGSASGSPIDKHIFDGDNTDDEETSAAAGAAPCDEWGEIGFDEDYAPLVVNVCADGIRQTALSAAGRIERIRGDLPAHLQRIVNELTKGEINWRERLAAFATTAFGGSRRWLPPSRRHVHRGLYLQSARQERMRAAVAIDTSGSTSGEASLFLGELENLLRSFGDYEITVIQCDAAVQKVDTFTPQRPVEMHGFALHGGGGTSFVPIFDYIDGHMDEPPSILVVLTDGFGDAPSLPPQYPVLWLLTHDGERPADWGEVAYFRNKE